jgi:glycosyltransferase involved in cell wall biosynthesis
MQLQNHPMGAAPEVSIVVPARNEERCLGACLKSLLAQEGVPFEVIVADDGSTDTTRAIATSFDGVRVITAAPLPDGWGGKSNACASAARYARGEWLLFTDADTVHAPDSLRVALEEAKGSGAVMLSYSPQQRLTGFAQRAVMPVIFAELARAYRPKEVGDPKSPTAAANGQYLLVRRAVYEKVGGHAAIAKCLLEDVEFARLVKRCGYAIRFRASDLVSTHMYAGWRDMRDGWTRNLSLLFPNTLALAGLRAVEFLTVTAATVLPFVLHDRMAAAIMGALAVLFWASFLIRIARAHFGWRTNAFAIFGLPIFAYLLTRSFIYYKFRQQVTWKGRSYAAASTRGAEERSWST